jgi:hypothetical protein
MKRRRKKNMSTGNVLLLTGGLGILAYLVADITGLVGPSSSGLPGGPYLNSSGGISVAPTPTDPFVNAGTLTSLGTAAVMGGVAMVALSFYGGFSRA